MRDGHVRSIVKAMLQDERCEIEKMFKVEREAMREASKADFARFEDLFKAELESGAVALSVPVGVPAERKREAKKEEANVEVRQLVDRVDMLHAFVAGMRSDWEVMSDTLQQTELRISTLQKKVEEWAVDLPSLQQSLESLLKEVEASRVSGAAEVRTSQVSADVGGMGSRGSYKQAADFWHRLDENRPTSKTDGVDPSARSQPTSRQAPRSPPNLR